MKTVTKSATKSVALVSAPVKAPVFKTSSQGIRMPIYGFVIGLAANKQGKAAQSFLSRAKAHHKGSGMTFPRVSFENNVHATMSDEAITSGIDAWLGLINAGQGRKVAGSAFSQALYDAYRVITG